jgi:hypothetical protein
VAEILEVLGAVVWGFCSCDALVSVSSCIGYSVKCIDVIKNAGVNNVVNAEVKNIFGAAYY